MEKDILFRQVGEWAIGSEKAYAEPFIDVWLDAVFTSPSGKRCKIPAFYDGDNTWRVRFSPDEIGHWSYQLDSHPVDEDLQQSGSFHVLPHTSPGFLKATPGKAWGFHTESGLPVFLMGDTTYNLFGAAHCEIDIAPFLRRRAQQGFNIFRVRCHVSPFHGPNAYSEWQTRRTWPWGGSEQLPRFDRFNLDYFQTVDKVLALAASLGVGFEMIMEAWAFEYPFNNRAVFLPEWEELWLRYLIARYDAYSSVYIWTLMNEYENYPDGRARSKYEANRWAIRTARFVKAQAPHGHPVAVHNGGPRFPPFAERFAMDKEAIDVVMFQDWGSGGEQDGWLAVGIDEVIPRVFSGWQGSAVFAEWGYERNPDLPITFPAFKYTDTEHNRRGAWRGAFCGMGIINGFENTWGSVMDLDNDQQGVVFFKHLNRFFTEVVPFYRLSPAMDLLTPQNYDHGYHPLVLATENLDIVTVYIPAGATFTLELEPNQGYIAQWFSPKLGEVHAAQINNTAGGLTFTTPNLVDDDGHPLDWALTLSIPIVDHL